MEGKETDMTRKKWFYYLIVATLVTCSFAASAIISRPQETEITYFDANGDVVGGFNAPC